MKASGFGLQASGFGAQIELTLDRGRVTTEVLVVDRLERPTPD